jgi:hypothetical protein
MALASVAEMGRRDVVQPAPRSLAACAITGFLLTSLALAEAAEPASLSLVTSLTYAPAPPDNPLKGFVPYPRTDTTFPHSLEWDYTKLSDVMTGPTNFRWAPFEAKLNAAASRGHQFVARFYLEWPGRPSGK